MEGRGKSPDNVRSTSALYDLQYGQKPFKICHNPQDKGLGQHIRHQPLGDQMLFPFTAPAMCMSVARPLCEAFHPLPGVQMLCLDLVFILFESKGKKKSTFAGRLGSAGTVCQSFYSYAHAWQFPGSSKTRAELPKRLARGEGTGQATHGDEG